MLFTAISCVKGAKTPFRFRGPVTEHGPHVFKPTLRSRANQHMNNHIQILQVCIKLMPLVPSGPDLPSPFPPDQPTAPGRPEPPVGPQPTPPGPVPEPPLPKPPDPLPVPEIKWARDLH
jgi:hypothetical protein